MGIYDINLQNMSLTHNVLNHNLKVSQLDLQLRRLGCRAGAHLRRCLLAIHSVVTSSLTHTDRAEEIPVINGHRNVNVNNDQLFHGCRRPQAATRGGPGDGRDRVSSCIRISCENRSSPTLSLPTLYILNAAANHEASCNPASYC